MMEKWRLQQVFCYRAERRLGDLIWRRRRSADLQLANLPEWSVGSQKGPAGAEDWDEATKWVRRKIVRKKISVGFTRDEVV